MLTIFFRSFFVYKLVNDILVYLRIYISTSWHQHQQQQQQRQQKEPFSSLSSSVVPSSPSSHNPRRMDANELKRVFQMFDRNADGQITKDELNGFLENMGIFIPDNEVTQMIDNVDVNGDGCIDADEFGALYQTLMDEREGEEDMREAFEVFDQNGDGFISVNELKSVLASLGLKQWKAAEDCEKMIMRVDVDGDGMVNYKEFKQMVRGGGFTAFTN